MTENVVKHCITACKLDMWVILQKKSYFGHRENTANLLNLFNLFSTNRTWGIPLIYDGKYQEVNDQERILGLKQLA